MHGAHELEQLAALGGVTNGSANKPPVQKNSLVSLASSFFRRTVRRPNVCANAMKGILTAILSGIGSCHLPIRKAFGKIE